MIIGREKEVDIIKRSINDDRSHFIVIYGRRGTGKTFLIKETINGEYLFQHSGLYKGTYNDQLKSFMYSLKQYGYKGNEKIKCWLDAFNILKKIVIESNINKKIIFIDELSWMDTPRSDFIMAVENF